MKYLTGILLFFIALTGLFSCEPADKTDVQDIIIVGGDTLGRNWDNLATKEEAEQARALGLTPEQYLKIRDEMKQKELEDRLKMQNEIENMQHSSSGLESESEFEYEFEPINFSDQMYKEKSQTVLTTDGREVVVGSNSPQR
jgi:hypothetical protein